MNVASSAAKDADGDLVPITCRFIPHDQWLTTHLASSWKIRQVKSYILAKCLSHFDAPDLEPPPADPRQGARPPSPITFAKQPHVQERRSVSPIQFARPETPDVDQANEEGGSKPVEDGGYEEDDEWDDQDMDEVVFVHRPPKVPPKLKDVNKKKRVHPHNVTIIRFSTGQTLEDDFTVGMYDFAPYELLEVHRAGSIIPLRRHALEDYCQPFWEGHVKVLKSTRESEYEWRDKFIVARDGILSICRNQNDHDPTHELPLDTLNAICTPDHLNMATTSWINSSGVEQRRIVCAKFAVPTDMGALTGAKREKVKSLKKLRLSKSKDEGPFGLDPGSSSPHGSASFVQRAGSQLKQVVPAPSRLRPTLDISAINPERRGSPPPSQPVPSIMAAMAPHDGPLEGDTPKPSRARSEGHRRAMSDDDSGNHSSSESGLSSPVFAHTPLTEKEEDVSDFEYPGLQRLNSKARLKDAYRPKFGSVKLGGKLHVDYEASTPEEASFAQNKRSKTPTPASTPIQGQWVVFDLGDDDAYTSFLRILHRWPVQNEHGSINSTFIPWVASGPGYFPDDFDMSDDSPYVAGAPGTESSTYVASESPRPRPMASMYPEWRLWATRRARDAGCTESAVLRMALGFTTSVPEVMSEKKRGKQRDTGEALSWSSSDIDGSESESEAEWHGWMGDIRRQAYVRKRQSVVNHYRDESGSTAPYTMESYSSSAQVSVSSSGGTRSPRSHAWSTNAQPSHSHSNRLPPRMALPAAFQHPKAQWVGQNLIPPDELLSPSYAGRRPSLPNIPVSPTPSSKSSPNRAASNPATLATIPLTPTPVSVGPASAFAGSSTLAGSQSSSSSRTMANGAPLPRRASSAGILGFNGLKKKTSIDQDNRERDIRERERDQQQRARRRLEKEHGKTEKTSQKDAPAEKEKKGHRKKLSISSGSGHHQQPQQQTQSGMSRTRTMLRRATSGSNLRDEGAALREHAMREPVSMREGVVREEMAREADAASQASSKKSEGSSTKKKKMSKSEWIVERLEDALDFVEGR